MLENKKLKGFEQHGVKFKDSNETQMFGFCPFCNKSKFFANIETLLWDCKSCGRAGNFNQFLAKRNDLYQANFKGQVASKLARNRGLRPQTLVAWGVGWSGSFYTIPVDGNPARIITDTRRYNFGTKPLATTGAKLSFIVPKNLTSSKRVWLCEGEWDGMALWECLHKLDINDDVYCAPGASNLPQKLLDMFYDKEVIVCYDNDDPGRRGAEKVAARLGIMASSLKFLHWSDGLPNGFDVRDLYIANAKDPKGTYKEIENNLYTNPQGSEITEAQNTAERIKPLTGSGMPPEEVYKIFGRWLIMKGPECLDILFGSIFANRLQGDPLWLFLVAPPGGMKTELLMSVSNAARIVTTTSLTPHALISGMNFSNGNDPSLIPKLNQKVLIIKDFTTILQMNTIARDEIFGTLRDIYDGKTEKHFGTGVRRYESKFGILAGVTPVIESLNITNMSLGERFIKYKLPHQEQISSGKAAIRQALKNIEHNDRMRKELADTGEKVLNREVDGVPRMNDETLEKIVGLAQWVAKLRGVVSRERYTGNINFKPMSEVGTRLAKQFAKLAYGITIYKMEEEVSSETYRTIAKVAQDTAPDRVEEVIKQLYIRDANRYHSTKELSDWTKFPQETVRYLLQDLALLGLVDREPGRTGTWRLKPSINRLMKDLQLYCDELAWCNRNQNKPTKKARRIR